MTKPLGDNIRKIQRTTNKSVFFYIPKDMLEAAGLSLGDYVKLSKRGTKISFEKYEE